MTILFIGEIALTNKSFDFNSFYNIRPDKFLNVSKLVNRNLVYIVVFLLDKGNSVSSLGEHCQFSVKQQFQLTGHQYYCQFVKFLRIEKVLSGFNFTS